MFPLHSPRPGLHSHCPSPDHLRAQLPPLHTSSRRNLAHVLLHAIVTHSFTGSCSSVEDNTENITVTLWLLRHFVHRQPPFLLNDCREEWWHWLQVMSTLCFHASAHARATISCQSTPWRPPGLHFASECAYSQTVRKKKTFWTSS